MRIAAAHPRLLVGREREGERCLVVAHHTVAVEDAHDLAVEEHRGGDRTVRRARDEASRSSRPSTDRSRRQPGRLSSHGVPHLEGRRERVDEAVAAELRPGAITSRALA